MVSVLPSFKPLLEITVHIVIHMGDKTGCIVTDWFTYMLSCISCCSNSTTFNSCYLDRIQVMHADQNSFVSSIG